jgi:hypothetical protein
MTEEQATSYIKSVDMVENQSPVKCAYFFFQLN